MDQPARWLGLDLGTWLGIAGIVFGIGGSYYFYWRAKAIKTLDYAIKSRLRLSASGEFGDKWFLGLVPQADAGTVIELETAALYDIRIKNTGRTPILASDYDLPVTLTATGSIIDAAITSASHPDMRNLGKSVTPTDPDWKHIDLDATSSQVVLPADLLNPGDWIDVQMIIQRSGSDPVVKSRLVGETRPTQRNQSILQLTFRQLLKDRDASAITIVAIAAIPIIVGIALAVSR